MPMPHAAAPYRESTKICNTFLTNLILNQKPYLMLFHNHFTPFSSRFKKAYPVKDIPLATFVCGNNQINNISI